MDLLFLVGEWASSEGDCKKPRNGLHVLRVPSRQNGMCGLHAKRKRVFTALRSTVRCCKAMIVQDSGCYTLELHARSGAAHVGMMTSTWSREIDLFDS